MPSHLRVISVAAASVQDAGRMTGRALGIPRGGAWDQLALTMGNRLLDNPDGAAAVEFAAGPLAVQAQGRACIRVLIAGDAVGTITTGSGAQSPCPAWQTTTLEPGETLQCTLRAATGAHRALLCVSGGVSTARQLGSRSTLASARLGTSALRVGDCLPVAPIWHGRAVGRGAGPAPDPALLAQWWAGQTRPEALWVIPGAHEAAFPRPARVLLEHQQFVVSLRSDRMGIRLDGAMLPAPFGGSMPSEAMPIGAVQVPPDGRLVLLGPDGPTTGGYPVIACVASLHHTALAHLPPRSLLRLRVITRDQALEAQQLQQAQLNALVPRRVPSLLLNADVGEDASPDGLARDVALLSHVHAINIACGGHAGDAATIRTLLRAAHAAGVLVGAHPSYPDRPNFGRVPMTMSPEELHDSLSGQLALLVGLAREEGVELAHVKPHGALYHAHDAETLAVLHAACARWCPAVPLLMRCNAPVQRYWLTFPGTSVLEEAFADRLLLPDGSLAPRTQHGSVIADPVRAAAVAHALRHQQAALLGLMPGLTLVPDTLCIHSDTPNALEIAAAVRKVIDA